MSLERLLRPKTIAVIGGGAWCESVIEQCLKSGFDGQLLAVHPKRDEVAGVKAVASVEALPWAPDASFIGVNRRITVEVLAELSERGSGGAVCFASGFLESEDADGASLQTELFHAAGDMAILGPNCYGCINNVDGAMLWPDQHGLQPVKTGVAILTQSSNIAINITMQKRGLPISYIITTGNQAQQDLASVAKSLLSDKRVTAIGLHIEGFKDVVAFEDFMFEARKKGVPVAALKVGASDEAQQATQSHTASVAGSEAGSQALLKRLGVASVNTLPELLETLKLMHVYKRIPGGRLSSLSCSGGEASLLADCVHRIPGLSLPPVPAAAAEILHDNLGPHVTKVNPLDYHTDIWRDRIAMATVFGAMTGEPYDLTVLVLDFPRDDRCTDEDWLVAIEAIVDASKQPGARVAVLTSLAENIPEHHCKTFMDYGVAALMELDVALPAVAKLVAAQQFSDTPLWPPRATEKAEPSANAPARTTEKLEHSTNTPDRTTEKPAHSTITLVASAAQLVDEASAKQILAEYGVSIPKHRLADSPEAVQQAAVELTTPWVLKGLGAAHKSELGLVQLNLTSPEKASASAAAMSAHTSQWLVEEMVTDTLVELLVGVVHDPAHGFVLTLGSGGILTEILQDGVSLLMPVVPVEVENALEKLKISPLLNGYRGKPACDKKAIVKQVMALQHFVESHRSTLLEIEINPLLCTASSAIAADALLTLKGST